jgi:bifunctional non-homologous end joining protein LigD
VWDNGQWIPESEDVVVALEKGDLKFTLMGKKLHGSWVLTWERRFAAI